MPLIGFGGGYGAATGYGLGYGEVSRLGQITYTLVVDSASHQHFVENIVVTQKHALAISSTLHNHTAQAISLIQKHTIQASSTQHNHTVDNLGVSPGSDMVTILNFDDVFPTTTGDPYAVGTQYGYSQNGARRSASAHGAFYVPSQAFTPSEARVTISGLVRVNATMPGLAGIAFGTGSGSSVSGYQFLIDNRTAASGSTASFQIRKNADTLVLANTGPAGAILPDQWYYIEASIRSAPQPVITARFYNQSTGELLATLSTNDTTYTSSSLMPGFYGYGVADYDNLRLKVGQAPATLVINNASHSITSPQLVVVQNRRLVIANTSHSHAADNLVVIHNLKLAVDGSLHGHKVDNVKLAVTHMLFADNTLHNHTVPVLMLWQSQTIELVDSATHGLFNDSTALSQWHKLIAEDTVHSLINQKLRIIDWTALGKDFGTYIPRFEANGELEPVIVDNSGVYIPQSIEKVEG